MISKKKGLTNLIASPYGIYTLASSKIDVILLRPS